MACEVGNIIALTYNVHWFIKMSYDEVIDFKELLENGKKCCNSGRWKPSIQRFETNLLLQTVRSEKKLKTCSYTFRRTNNFILYERGKKRIIKAHPVRDRQVLKAFCKVELKPQIDSFILPSNCASQVGKGTEDSIKRFKADLSHAYRKYGRDFYVTTCDFHDYFGSEDHKYILDTVILSDEGCKEILKKYLKLFPGSIGVGIGGEPSQDVSTVYASKIDRFLLCDRRVISNGRYMDDFYFITRTKAEAKDVLNKVRDISENVLHLTLNPKMTKTNHMTKDTVVWLKKRSYLTQTGKIVMRLTRKNVKAIIKSLYFEKEQIENGTMPRIVADMSILCWCSYARRYNARQDMKKVVDIYMILFDVPWDKAKILFKRHPVGFIESVNLTQKEKRSFYKDFRQKRMINIIFEEDIRNA